MDRAFRPSLLLPLPRRVQPELLDSLPADDPAAQRSRADLRRLHHVMGTFSILLRAVDRVMAGSRPRRILELGAGDGSLLLRLARRRSAQWPDVAVSLLDRQPVVAAATLNRLVSAGWTPEIIAADVFDWLEGSTGRWDLIVTTLFVHHFEPAGVERLLALVAARTAAFVCCEPRRSALPLAGSHLVGLLGAGPVTREDAVLSVHAGFRGLELGAAWPDDAAWQLRESASGLFTHC
ncbi:MAG: methyltransferase domain-containing protein, partial [Betaproteobacteria bacterium]